LDPKEFEEVNTNISSDTLLSVLNLFREKLPCSENFWRYKRNYELHIKSLNASGDGAGGTTSGLGGSGISYKELASPKLTHMRPLSPYSESR